MKKEELPLSGIKVVDASTVLAGPSVGMYLAELGAEVLKVEHPKYSDVTRSWKLPGEPSESDVSAYFSSINYGKTYQKLDLKNTADRNAFGQLISDSDILLMNFKRSDYAKFQLTNKDLAAINPQLITGKISGYGTESDRVAYDLILQAESGFMSMNGQPDGPPTKMPVAFVDVLAAHHLKEALLLALYTRERSGKGAILNVSLYDAAVSSLVNQASNYLMTGNVPQRLGSKHPNIAPYGELFTTRDGRTITFAIGSDAHFQKLCETLNAKELIEDDRFLSNQDRVVHRETLYALLSSHVSAWSSNTLLDQLQSLNVPAGAVKNLEEVFSDPKAKSLVLEETIDGILTKRVASAIFT
ncbi:MAG: CaiB/BaiF CoA-transferase family protein [Crocinitomicaceae bacterium]